MFSKVNSLAQTGMVRASGFFLIAGTCALVFWPTVYEDGVLVPIRFELLFICAAACFALAMFRRQGNTSGTAPDFRDRSVWNALLFLIGSIALATVVSFAVYGLRFNMLGIGALLKAMLGIAVFAVLCHHLRHAPSFYKTIAWSFVISTSLFIPLLLFPDAAMRWGFLSGGFRFQGATANPALFCSLAMIAFCVLYSLLLKNIWTKGSAVRTAAITVTLLGMCGLIWWSQFRSYTVALFIGVAGIAVLYGTYVKMKPWKIAAYAGIGMLIVSSSFFLTPGIVQRMFIYSRVLGVQGSVVQSEPSSNESRAQSYGASIESFRATLAADPRITMWEHYVPVLLSHPLGLGVNYQPAFAYKWTYNGYDAYLPPFFVFNTWALGGIVAAYCVCYLSWLAVRRFKESFRQTDDGMIPYRIAAISAFGIIWFISLFSGIPIEHIPFWIVLALVLGGTAPSRRAQEH